MWVKRPKIIWVKLSNEFCLNVGWFVFETKMNAQIFKTTIENITKTYIFWKI